MPILPSADHIERPIPRPSNAVVVPNVVPVGVEKANALYDVSQQIGNTVGEIDRRLTAARRGAELSDALSQATLGLGELEQKYRRDQDFKTSPARFLDESKLLQDKIVGGIQDATVKQHFAQEYRKLQVSKQLSVLTSATQQEGDFHVAQLEGDLRNVYAPAAAGATDPIGRKLAVDTASMAISSLQQSGWISDVKARQMRDQFGMQVDMAMVMKDTQASPEAVVNKLITDPTYAQNLDPVTRERVTNTAITRADTERREAEANAAKTKREAADALMKDGRDLIAAGKLTPAFVAKARPLVSDNDYGLLLHALKTQGGGGAGEDRKEAFAEMMDLVHPPGGLPPDPEAVKKRVLELQKHGSLTQSSGWRLINEAYAADRREGPKDAYAQGKDYIDTTIKPSQMVVDLFLNEKKAEAKIEYDNWYQGRVAAGQTVTAKEAQEKAREITTQKVLILRRRAGADNIQGATDADKLKTLNTQLGQLKAKLNAKQISPDEYLRESEGIKKKLDALNMNPEKSNGR